ncbi:MAG TPA: hypothetical protein VHZ97_02950, partial [Pseudonocardiaceae bacterium]|nr:hypothetical protein [Pseudonocardiaceae bacterium]
VDTRKGTELTGLDVRTGEPATVSSAAVFPAKSVASGRDWAKAVRAAVILAANANAVAALSNVEPFPRLELDGVELTARGARYLKLLEIVDQTFTIHDLSGPLGLPTFAFSTPQGTVAYTSDLDVALALEQGLERTLLAYQAQAADQPAYAPEPVPDLPANLRGELGTWPSSVSLDEVVARLTRDGGRVVAVPLDHDPAIAQLCPFVVTAVVVNG